MSNQFPNQPKGVEVEHLNNYITIKYNWLNTKSWVFIIISLLGLITIFLFLIIVNYEGKSLALIVSFYSIPFFWSAIAILWKPVTIIMNKTSITVDDKAISINKPFLPTNNFAIRLSKLKTIFSKVRRETDNKEINIYHWQVYARTYNNKDKKLIETNKREQMLFIEKTLKDYLNIDDE